MRTIMWAKNVLVFIILVLLILIVYWHQKITTLELQQETLLESLVHQQASRENNFGSIESYNQGIFQINKGGNDPNEQQVIIYNRIPKTGSTSLMGIAYELCTKNSYSVIHVNTTKNSHVLSPFDQIRFAQNLSGWIERRPAIFHGHIGYLDFATLGVQLKPLYINIVRDPIDRLVSYYYFLRYGDDFRPEVIRKRKGNKETFDECVARDGPDCNPTNLWMQIPFFCGHHSSCWEPGSSFALSQAKSNLVNSYILVGLTENMRDFITLLEATLPKFFKGAVQLFNSEGKSHLRKTYGKTTPSKETIKKIRKSKIWQMEQDFYMFAKKNFMAIKKKSHILNEAGSGPTILADSELIPKFRFEKIRPKK